MGLIGAHEATAIATIESLWTREALVTLLIAAARADGCVSPHEADRIEHAVASMRLFRGSTPETSRALFATIVKRLNVRGTDLAAAAAAVPSNLRETAFVMAIDVLLADRRWSLNEERFATELQARLGVGDRTAAKVVEVITLKNAG